MKNKIIAIGDSWAWGEGAWPDYLLEKYNHKVQDHKYSGLLSQEDLDEIQSEEQKHSWLRKLRDKYYPEYDILNKGLPGHGNHSAVRNLRIDTQLNRGDIIIAMFSMISRWDFYKNGVWQTVHPIDQVDTDCDESAAGYFLHNVKPANWAIWTVLDMLELQDIAKVNGCELYMCNGFGDINLDLIGDPIVQKVDALCWLHYHMPVNSLLEKLLVLDNAPVDNLTESIPYYSNLERNSTYLTNCMGTHPTILGHEMIADTLAQVIQRLST